MEQEVLLVAILLGIAWQLNQAVRAIRSLTVELTTARWERNQREKLKAEREEKNALALRGKFADGA